MIGRLRQVSAWLGLAGSVAFCMTAGAAGFHQIEVAKHTAMLTADISEPETAHPVATTIVNVSAEPGAYVIFSEQPEEEVPAPNIREISDEDRDLIASTIAAEAENQPLEGKILVAHVILNRVDSEVFPDTIREVISAPGQFTTWSNGQIQRAVPSVQDYEAVKLALKGEGHEPVYFFRNQHYGCGKPYTQVGDHYFSTMKGV